MSNFDFRKFVAELNAAARSHPIGALQEIRAKLHGKQQSGEKLFREPTITDEWACHYGGRAELQFNIGYDGATEDMIRSGVAFSFETSRSYPVIDPLIDKAKLFNDFLRINSELYGDMRMWHWQNQTRSGETRPGPIPPEQATIGVFLFLGNLRPISEVTHDLVLNDMDRLLPLYKYIESRGRIQPLPNIGQQKFIFQSGRNSTLATTKASYAQRELDVNLRHNILQGALQRQLSAQYGIENVHKEVSTGNGNIIDLVVRQSEGYWFYEIKTYQSPRACIREAIGQLLEYAFWPESQNASRLIVVGETAPDQDVIEYCRILKKRFSLPIEYQQIVTEKP